MQRARVVGHATATVKHASLTGCRLLIVQPLGAAGGPDGEPLLCLDQLGAAQNMTVVIVNDGPAIREAVGMKTTPIRYMVQGLCDA
jgi:ethanolamine utilization protein EutN